MKLNLNNKKTGFSLIEITISLFILLFVAITLLEGNLSLLTPRQWVVKQSLVDAYLTKEKSIARSLNYNDAISQENWPTYPSLKKFTEEIGKVPGGRAISAQIIRTKKPYYRNNISAGGTFAEQDNHLNLEVWALESHIIYNINNKEYIKTATIIRAK